MGKGAGSQIWYIISFEHWNISTGIGIHLAKFLADCLECVLYVFRCFISNCHKVSGLKQNLFISSKFGRSGLGGLKWLPCLGSHKAEIKVSAWLGSSLEVFRKSPFPASWRWLTESLGAVGLTPFYPCWLSARGHS